MLKTYNLPKDELEGQTIKNALSLGIERAFFVLGNGQGVTIYADLDKDGQIRLGFDSLPQDKTIALLSSEQDKVSLALDELAEARKIVEGGE